MKGEAHGIIVYCGEDPVGWCQFGPKEELLRIDRMRGYKPTARDPWRITCLFIAPGHRRKGLAAYAIAESVRAMWKAGAEAIEAYPVEGERSASLLWMGTPPPVRERRLRPGRPPGQGKLDLLSEACPLLIS
jgi:GNAT superfamily N-acetyltransferase